ncbi:MAG: lysophospholipid acyltransferase family protein [Acidimicrobiia bacterium]|nr:lysophospholipid acyltransferase family protein [Acidimicrobiia bacterium]
MLRKILLGVRSAIAVPLFWLFTMIISALFILVMTLRLRRVGEFFVQLWSRVFLWVPPVRYTVSGTENVQPGTQYFFLANHLSNFDIPLLFRAIPTPIRYLAKKELYKIPVFAQALKVAGIVKIDRTAGASSYAAINEGVARAKANGYSLIVFPEGTRSRDGALHPFKKGAFRMAISTGLPVVPVTVNGTWEVWPPGSKLFYRGHADVVIHEPIPTAELTVKDIDTLRAQVYDVIDEQFHELHQS